MVDGIDGKIQQLVEKPFEHIGDFFLVLQHFIKTMTLKLFLLPIIEAHVIQVELSSFDQRDQDQPAKIVCYWVLAFYILGYLHAKFDQNLLAFKKLLL